MLRQLFAVPGAVGIGSAAIPFATYRKCEVITWKSGLGSSEAEGRHNISSKLYFDANPFLKAVWTELTKMNTDAMETMAAKSRFVFSQRVRPT
ncbi:hypothetical protein [Sinorhizobium meliloti]|uniref:hypothetical protein n=1 Tax=Rhizobium meliloti TaxID=382 RepID=UPI0030CCB4BC